MKILKQKLQMGCYIQKNENKTLATPIINNLNISLENLKHSTSLAPAFIF